MQKIDEPPATIPVANVYSPPPQQQQQMTNFSGIPGVVGNAIRFQTVPSFPGQKPSYGGLFTATPALIGKNPIYVECPKCNYLGLTAVTFDVGLFAWLMVAGACFVFPCAVCVPCFVDDFKDAVHICPQCRTPLAEFKRV